MPEGYKMSGYPKGKDTFGIVFNKGEHNEIVFKKAKLEAKYPSQRVDYVTYKVDGNKFVATNGDLIYFDKKNKIVRENVSGHLVAISEKELKELGVIKPSQHPDVHIPMTEYIKKYGNK